MPYWTDYLLLSPGRAVEPEYNPCAKATNNNYRYDYKKNINSNIIIHFVLEISFDRSGIVSKMFL